MSKYYVMVLLLCCASAHANNSLNLSIPNGSQSYQSDKFRAGDLDCSNAIGGGTTVEFGVTGIINQNDNPLSSEFGNNGGRDVGVYGRIIIPLDGPKERINCNTLYELELRKKRLEVEKLQQEINQLRKLQFEK
jgi:hypothetical protein